MRWSSSIVCKYTVNLSCQMSNVSSLHFQNSSPSRRKGVLRKDGSCFIDLFKVGMLWYLFHSFAIVGYELLKYWDIWGCLYVRWIYTHQGYCQVRTWLGSFGALDWKSIVRARCTPRPASLTMGIIEWERYCPVVYLNGDRLLRNRWWFECG